MKTNKWVVFLLAACTTTPAQVGQTTSGPKLSSLIRYDPSTSLDEARADCKVKGGNFNECGSACDPGDICIQVCVPVCEPEGYKAPSAQPSEVADKPVVEGSLKTNPTTHDVQIKDFKFTPTSLEINKGDTVRWTNLDGVKHTATGDKFDSDLLAQSQSWEFTFTDAGSFDYHCTPHPRMQGQVVVS